MGVRWGLDSRKLTRERHLFRGIVLKYIKTRKDVMRKVLAIAVALSILSAGCASTAQTYMKTPEAELCMNYLTFPSYNIHQSSRAAAIQMRGIDCRPYAGAASARNQANQNFENSLRGMANQQPYQSATPKAAGMSCNFTRSTVSGMNKICFYNCVGSGHAMTVGAAELCPLTTTR